MKTPTRLPLISGLSVALAATLALSAQARQRDLQAPAYKEMAAGQAGPQTNDRTQSGNSDQKAPALETLQLRPKGPVDESNSNQSHDATARGKSGKAPIDFVSGARAVGLEPLQLLESGREVDKKLDTLVECERQEMHDLWEATLNRSPDIQFVVQRLMPTSDHAHLSSVLSKLLSSAIFGAVGALNTISPSVGSTAITNSGGSLISSLLNTQDKKNLRKAQISEAETIMLYRMVRDTADKLVDSYREYRKTVAVYERAGVDLQVFQDIARNDKLTEDKARSAEIDYILRKQQRDVEGVRYDLRKFRQQIVDLAGSEATDVLDKQIKEEYSSTELALPFGATPWDNSSQPLPPGS